MIAATTDGGAMIHGEAADGYLGCEKCGRRAPLMMGKCSDCREGEEKDRPRYRIVVKKEKGWFEACIPKMPGRFVYGDSIGRVKYEAEKLVFEKTGVVPSIICGEEES